MASHAAQQIDKTQQPDARLRQPSGMRLVDDVADSLEDAILAGRMKPGERLTEMRLCDELAVSRTTLREALLILQQRGFVRSEPRRGTFVTRLSREESMDLCRARSLLESYALASGYDQLSDERFDEMQGVVDEMAACAYPDDLPRLIQLDHAFHDHVMAASDSPAIYELWSGMNGRMSALILSSIEHHHAGTRDVALFHQVLLDALRSGDAKVGMKAVVVHYVGDGEGDSRSLSEIAQAIESMAAVPPALRRAPGAAGW
jgi:DNA-binding GntR family transcriptional regulator